MTANAPFHEAGHAVVAEVLNVPVVRVDAATCRHERVDGDRDIVIGIAGALAAGIAHEPATEPSPSDLESLVRELHGSSRSEIDEKVMGCVRKTHELLRSNWSLVQKIADRIKAQGALSGDEVGELVGRLPPPLQVLYVRARRRQGGKGVTNSQKPEATERRRVMIV